MSRNGDISISRSSSKRGRIAQVLASARASLHDPSRASLQEPTRPVTPLMVDQWTSFPSSLNGISFASEGPGQYKAHGAAFSSSTKTNVLLSASVDSGLERRSLSAPSAPSSASVHQDLLGFLVNLLDMVTDNSSSFTDGEFCTMLQQLNALRTSLSRTFRTNPNKEDLKGVGEVRDIVAHCLAAIMSLSVHTEFKQAFLALLLRTFTVLCQGVAGGDGVEERAVMEVMDLTARHLFRLRSQDRQQSGKSADLTANLAREKSLLVSSIDSLGGIEQASESNANFGGKGANEDLIKEVRVLVNYTDVLCEALAASWEFVSSSWSLHSASSTSVVSAMSCTAHCCAMLRIATTDETERRRLCRTSCVGSLSKILDGYATSKVLQSWTAVKRGNEMTAVLVQAVAILRNFSLDKAGRKLLDTSHHAPTLCTLLHIYSTHADILLNLARVLAKLSLYEGFRAQMSADPKNVQYLIALIDQEANKCKSIMDTTEDDEKPPDAKDGDGEEEASDGKDSWPHWYTWPLISRVCFTLGNLTNSNEKNRAVIGTTFDCAGSIVLLLQVCSSSLCTLTVRRQSQHLGKEDAKANLATGPAPKAVESKPATIFAFAGGLGLEAPLPLTSSSSSVQRTSPYVGLGDDESASQTKGKGEEDNDGRGGGGEGDYDVDNTAEVELRDAVIKLIRLLANLSIDEQIGSLVGSKMENLQTLLELLVVCDDSLEQEEMLLNVIAALTNLTYYTCQRVGKLDKEGGDRRLVHRIEKMLVTLSSHLKCHLFHENAEIVLETARVLGNLTRRASVVDNLMQQHVHRALLLLLDHSQLDIVVAVLGTLVNMSSHPDGRQGLLQPFGEDGDVIDRLDGLLKRCSLQHMPVLGLTCQVLYNTVTSADFRAQDLDDHWEVLAEFADNLDVLADTASRITSKQEGGDSQAFVHVATALLDQLRSMLKK